MIFAAGVLGSPGIFSIFPINTTIKPAPFDKVTSLTVTLKFFGYPNFDGSSDIEYCVFAIHTGKLLFSSFSISFIDFSASGV